MNDIDLNTLNRDGIVRCRQHLTNNQVLDVTRHLKSCRVYNAHVREQSDKIARRFEDAFGNGECVSHNMADVLNAPHLLAFATQFTDFAGSYLETPNPLLYSANAFWTRPGHESPRGEIQTWHRDADDKKFLVLFMFGTDVLTAEDGAHMFQKGTQETTNGGGEVETVTGAAGFGFFADTRGMHMGVKPQRHERLLIWFRWGVTDPPPSYVWDKLEPATLQPPFRHILESDKMRASLKLVAK